MTNATLKRVARSGDLRGRGDHSGEDGEDGNSRCWRSTKMKSPHN